MSKTPAITIEWLRTEANRFGAYNISAEALALINSSEIIKADMRAYAISDYAGPG